MDFQIVIRLKDEVLDAAGRTLAERLASIGYPEVKEARIGRYIELEVDLGDRKYAEKRLEEMCTKVLANSLIEEFHVLGE